MFEHHTKPLLPRKEYHRRIVRNAAQDQYRFVSIVTQVVQSDAFRKREAAPVTPTLTTAVPDSMPLAKAGAP